MAEQQLVGLLHSHLSCVPVKPLDAGIYGHMRSCPDSPLLSFLLGVYHEQLGQPDQATALFRKCIGLEQLFLPPYYHLCRLLLSCGRVPEAYDVCSGILCKSVLLLHPTSLCRTKRFDLADHLKLCSMFEPHLHQGCLYSLTIRMFGAVHRKVLKMMPEAWASSAATLPAYAHVLLVLVDALLHADPEQARTTCLEGYRILLARGLDARQLLGVKEMYYVTDQHCETSDLQVEPDDVEAAAPPLRLSQVQGKIRLGYLSPDFNRNAVGLFMAPLLGSFDRDKFEVHCFHYGGSDVYTPQFENAPGIVFHKLDSAMSDARMAARIRSCKIHVVFDLIVRGGKSRFGIVQCLKKQASPAPPFIVNYLGYPASGMSNAYDYRITDSLSDPLPSQREPFIKFRNRPFLCWSLFRRERLPHISKGSREGGVLRVGIFNRSVKHHQLILSAWEAICKNNPRIVLCIKRDERMHDLGRYHGFPKQQLQFLPFMHTLQEYLEAHNNVDVCADTFPYSGTTTTCTALAMGVPVISIYNPACNRHVSNVSGSIIKSMGREEWLCTDLESYTRKLSAFQPLSPEQRQGVRQQFLDLMDPLSFMREFEQELLRALD